jgi:hypothetical protein
LVELLLFMVGVPIASNFEVTFTEIHKSNGMNARAFTGHPAITEDSRDARPCHTQIAVVTGSSTLADDDGGKRGGARFSACGKQSATAVDRILLMRQHAV